MTGQRITKRTVDALEANGTEFTVWDDSKPGFGVRVRPTGAKSYVVVYRAGRRARRAGPALHDRIRRQNHARARQGARQGHPGVGGAWPRSSKSEDH